MADREQPYDPYIPSGGAQGGAGAQAGGNQRTAALQAVRASFHPSSDSRLPLDDVRPLFADSLRGRDGQQWRRTPELGATVDVVKAIFSTPSLLFAMLFSFQKPHVTSPLIVRLAN